MRQRSSTIVKALESEIMDGSLTPGERLPSEEKLCARFNASRTVIREAIQQLRTQGLYPTQIHEEGKGKKSKASAPSKGKAKAKK